MVQVTSSEDKAVVMTTLLSEGKDIGSLLMDIENKKEYIRIMEDEHRRKQSEEQEDYPHSNDTLKASDWPAAELDGGERAGIEGFDQPDQTMTEIKQGSLFKRRTRDRKSARKNGH